VGVVIGLLVATALTRLLSSLLFGVSPLDPVTYSAVGIILAMAAALASYVSVHRATAVDPLEALNAKIRRMADQYTANASGVRDWSRQ